MLQTNKFLLLAAVCTLTFVACDDDDDQDIRTLTFEDAEGQSYWADLIDSPEYGGAKLYGEYDQATNMYSGPEKDYVWADENTLLKNNGIVEAWGSKVFWNGGMAVSNYTHAADGASYANQLSTLSGGHNGSKNFCVSFGSGEASDNLPAIYFSDSVARVINKMYVANTSYVINSMTNGDDYGTPKATETDFFKVLAYGFDAAGKQTATAEIYLTQNGEISTEWQEWNLAGLGAVVSVKFSVEQSQKNDYGNVWPNYFAFDDVEVVF